MLLSEAGGSSAGQPIIQEMPPCAIFQGHDPDVGVERDLTRQIRIGVRLGSRNAVEAGLPAALFVRSVQACRRGFLPTRFMASHSTLLLS